MINVVFPTDEYVKKYRKAYLHYIMSGFKQIKNVNVFQEEYLNSDSFNNAPKCLFAIDLHINNEKRRVWYDWSDFQRFVYPEVISKDELYFKVECTQGHIDRFKINPIGQGVTNVYKYINNLIKLRHLNFYDYDIIGVFRATSPKPFLKSIRIDACKIISELPYKKLLKLKKCQHRPLPPKEFLTSQYYNYINFLEKTKKSKITLLMPGMGELSWRVTEALGLGCCTIMPRITTVLPGNPKNCWIEVKRDLSNLKEKTIYYLTHESERKQIEKNALQYYEKWLSPKAQANNILTKVIDYEKNL